MMEECRPNVLAPRPSRKLPQDWTAPQNVGAQIWVPAKQTLRKHGYPPDKQQKATQALQEIDKINKQPNETDAAFQMRKEQMEGGVYSSLGMVHLERSRLAVQAPAPSQVSAASH